MPPARTDPELLAAHRAGNGRAFGELAARHHGRLWAVAVRILHHPEDAADAVQEALVAAYRGADGYRGEAAVRTWLTRILINRCIDRLRRERGRVESGWTASRPDIPVRGPATWPPSWPPGSRCRTRWPMLPAAQRVAVVLVDVQGWSVAEVAEVLEVPVGTVKSRCARARARLAVLLGHLREGETR